MRLVFYIGIVATLCLGTDIYAQQELSTRSKKAARFYYEADEYIFRRQYPEAIRSLEKAIQKDDEFIEAYYRLGVVYKDLEAWDLAGQYLEKARSFEGSLSQIRGISFHLGEFYFLTDQYDLAEKHLEQFLDVYPRDDRRRQLTERYLENARFAAEKMKDPLEFDPVPLSPDVNAFQLQYFPVFTIDQQALIFTRRLGNLPSDDEDIVVSYKRDGKWSPPVGISDSINTGYNEGTCTISADGRTLIFTACQSRDRYGSCDLFISRKTGNVWGKPENLGKNINTEAWESQPSLSADGRTLYFVSDRRGGYGRRDILVSHRTEDGRWTQATNLGPEINTRGDDISPFIHVNGRTLYFATDGRTGFGGMDLFYSENTNGKWSEPENLGYPINTSDDQVSLFITVDGQKGYYSHEVVQNGRKRSILFEFDIPEPLKLKYPANFVFGKVRDSKTHYPLKATIELFDITEKNKKVSMVDSDSVTGEYVMALTWGAEYALYIDKPGYLFKSLSFDYKEEDLGDPIHIDIDLDPISTGVTTTLNNIFFDFDSYELKEESFTELDRAIRFMNTNPGVRVMIEGHTDDVGPADYNKTLSLNRARSVYNYLADAGVPKERLEYKGFGFDKPKVPNTSDENRKLNRRIEFRIL